MANQIHTSATETSVIVPEVWSAKFFKVLLDFLPYRDCIDQSYLPDAVRTDTINIASVPEFSDAEELAEGAAGDADSVTITSQQLLLNRKIYKDFIVTDKAKRQSLEFMDQVRDMAIHSILKKMETTIQGLIAPSTTAPDHTIAYDSGTTLALADILEVKELLDVQNVPDSDRFGVMAAAQWNDLFNITGFISRDFIPAGSPLTSGSIATPLAGFMPRMTNLLTGGTSHWFHRSFMTFAVDKQLSVSQYDLGVDGVRGFRTNIDLDWGLKQLDNTRVVQLG